MTERNFHTLQFFRPEIPKGFQENPGGGHAGGMQYPPAGYYEAAG